MGELATAYPYSVEALQEEMFFLAVGLPMDWNSLLMMAHVDRIWLVQRLSKHNRDQNREYEKMKAK